MTKFKIERMKIPTSEPRKLKATWTVETAVDYSAFYAPYIPIQMMKPKEFLIHLHNQKLQYRTYGRDTKEKADSDGEIMKTINEIMQANYPGQYIVEEYYDAKRMCFALKLKFNSPQEETMWTIKNS